MNWNIGTARLGQCGAITTALLAGTAASSSIALSDTRHMAIMATHIAHAIQGDDEDDYPWIVQRGEIVLDLEMLFELANNAAERPVFTLELFDAAVDIQVQYADVHEDEFRFSIAGAVPRGIGSDLTLSVYVDSAYGVLSVPGLGLYEIRTTLDGIHQLTQLDESLMPECGVGKVDLPLPPFDDRTLQPTSGTTPLHHVPTVNVMVVYTPAARNDAGGTNGMLAMIDTAILQTNQALAGSNAGMLVHLTSAHEVSYVESNNMGDDLTHLQDPNSGQLDIVHSLRVADCADLVALLSHNPSYNFCGLAWMPDGPVQNNPGFWADWAFSATWTNCIPNLTFAHELAHNLGCHHDHNNATGNSSFPYAFGHRFTGNSGTLWRTVMAYAPGLRIGHYSSPNIFFDGMPTGVPAGQPDPADNAQAIANNAPHIATYRDLIGGTCPPVVICHWDNTSGLLGVDGPVLALVEYDDGTGPSLYAGGLFTQAGNQIAPHIARWDGSQWHPVGTGLSGEVRALAVFDDGSGPSLYAGGAFSMPSPGGPVENIARWDVPSGQWMPVGFGLGGIVNALTVFDDGTGDSLYAGGLFTATGSGNPANRIAAWDGNQWLPVAGGVGAVASDQVVDMTVHNDGSGDALYVGGRFTVVDFGMPAENIAKWDGVSWSSLMPGLDNTVIALKSFDDGTGLGPQLFAGGIFLTSAGVQMNNIARLHAGQWHPLGNGLPGPSAGVHALDVFNDGSGDRLYVGGQFGLNVPAGTISHITAWDQFNQNWIVLDDGVNASVDALAVHDDGSGTALFAGGHFTASGFQPANFMASWDGCPSLPPSCAVCPPGSFVENEPCGTHVNDFCGQSGCAGHCGGQAPMGCWCDVDCCSFGDCCMDQHLVCNLCTWGPTPITCNQHVCGTLWIDPVTGSVDFDRYALDVVDLHGTGQATITIEIEADIAVTIWVDNGECPGDPDYELYGSMLDVVSCSLTSHTVVVPAPGVRYLNVQAAGTPDTCPDESAYTMYVDVDTCITGPANSICANATPVGVVAALPFDNIGAVTDGPADPACGFSGVDDSDVWFEFVANHGGLHMVTVDPDLQPGFQPDRLLAAYHSGCPVAGQVPLDCVGPIGGAAGCVTFTIAAGDQATIRTGTPGGAAGQGPSLLYVNDCPADLNGDGIVNTSDLLILFNFWGPCPPIGICVGDLNCDGDVDVSDLLILLGSWGTCP